MRKQSNFYAIIFYQEKRWVFANCVTNGWMLKTNFHNCCLLLALAYFVPNETARIPVSLAFATLPYLALRRKERKNTIKKAFLAVSQLVSLDQVIAHVQQLTFKMSKRANIGSVRPALCCLREKKTLHSWAWKRWLHSEYNNSSVLTSLTRFIDHLHKKMFLLNIG